MEVLPEMMDYAFVQTCNNVDELKAIMASLISGEHGKYPHLEETVRNKLVSLLPEKERKKIVAMNSKPSDEDVNNEKCGLEGWLEKINVRESQRGADTAAELLASTHPIRSTAKIIAPSAPITKHAKPGDKSTATKKKLTRKEKLSTKQYFEEWAKFEDESDSDDDICVDTESKNSGDKPSATRDAEMKELTDLLANNMLQPTEREFLSNREREKGNEHFKAKENDDAHHCYTKSILLDPDNAKAFANRASVLVRLERLEEALQDCTKAFDIDPTYIKALAKRGMIYHQLKRFEEAASDFQKCHSLDPNGGYSQMQAKSEEKLKEASESKQTMTRMIIEEVNHSDEDDESIEEVFTPGALVENNSMMKENKLSTKKKDCVSSLKQTDDKRIPNENKSSDAWQKISIVEASDSDEDNSKVNQESLFMRRVEIVEENSDDENPIEASQKIKDDSVKLKEEGNAAMKANQIDQAIELYSQAIELDPSNVTAINNLAEAHIRASKFDEAIVDATMCLALEPNNTKALFRRGHAKLTTSKNEAATIKSALADFEAALSFKPPKDQQKILSKKIQECQKLLRGSNTNPSGNKDHNPMKNKSKRRNHDSSALCF